MHELGVVFHIQKDLEDVAHESNVGHIGKVVLKAGEVSGIVPELLQDAWQWSANKKDLFRDCELKIETTPAITKCEACGQTYKTVQYGKTCPNCGSANTYLQQGNELEIKEIEAEEATERQAAKPQATNAQDAVTAANPLPID